MKRWLGLGSCWLNRRRCIPAMELFGLACWPFGGDGRLCPWRAALSHSVSDLQMGDWINTLQSLGHPA